MIDIALVAVLIAALFVFFALYARVMHHRVLYDPPKPIAGISASAATAVAYAGAAMMVLIPVLPVFVVLGSRRSRSLRL